MKGEIINGHPLTEYIPLKVCLSVFLENKKRYISGMTEGTVFRADCSSTDHLDRGELLPPLPSLFANLKKFQT